MQEDSLLGGLRVIDMATGIAAPVAAMILAEVGADVIKVEPPEGDPMRGQPGFAVWNRSKRSVTLNSASEAGKLEVLLSGADVLFHSYTQREAKALGLDDAALAARHPHLIVCGVTGFPTGHAAEDMAARDTLVLAEMGVMDEQMGVRRDGPIYLRLPLGSWHAASLAAIGVLARLIHRDRGGRPGPAHTSLCQGALITMNMYWQRAETPTAALSRSLPKDIIASLFECSDGVFLHIMMGCAHTPMVQEEFSKRGEAWVAEADAAMGEGYWVSFPHFGAVREVLKTKPHDVWLEHFRQHDVPVQPVMAMGQIYKDEQARVNGYVLDVEDPTFGATKQPGIPFHVNPPPRAPRGLRPLGADNATVFAESVAKKSSPSMAKRAGAPLAGVKVLDMGGALAGPLGPMILGDLGAEVIKLEPPEGDMMRVLEANFSACQRGKRGLAIQLKNPAAKDVLRRLVEQVDIVHHNLRQPAARKLGIDYETLRQINPKIIYTHVSSYGPQGERKDWPGMDQMFQSSCGWELAGAGRENPPIWHRFGFTDHLCALASVQGTLLALRHRDRTGDGQFVAASLLGATILTASETIGLSNGEITPFRTIDPLQLGIDAFERIYQAKDAWIAVSEPDRERQRAMLAALRVDQADACEAAIRSMPQEQALKLLRAAGIGCAPVRINQCKAFLEAPSNYKAGIVASYPHAVYGQFEQAGAFWDFGDLSVKLERAPPALGEHTREILQELRYSPAEIDAMAEFTVTGPRLKQAG